mmetsp:Transcript_36844/g.56419  ORF Transcript_36844/g.56419 Transcript_36844/m.56419 type:complete len:86 (+) Transcript_36844:874-1131(+)
MTLQEEPMRDTCELITKTSNEGMCSMTKEDFIPPSSYAFMCWLFLRGSPGPELNPNMIIRLLHLTHIKNIEIESKFWFSFTQGNN